MQRRPGAVRRALQRVLAQSLLIVLCALSAVACDRSDPAACAPRCPPGACGGSDGCGGVCSCEPEQDACTPRCTPETCGAPDGCGGTCACDASEGCGECATGELCIEGACVCQRACEGKACHAPDGCGGTCDCAEAQCDGPDAPTCATRGATCGEVCGERCGECGASEVCVSNECRSAVSCRDCSLPLSLIAQESAGGGTQLLTLAIDHQPLPGAQQPRMADLRLRIEGGAQLVQADAGAAVFAAGKDLYVDRFTGLPWKVRADGSVQFLVYGLDGMAPLGAGRLLTLVFKTDGSSAQSFMLEEREQTFAPPEADHALLSSHYGLPLVVAP